MKRLAVIGRGTAGAISALTFSGKYEIDWYFDSNITPQAVGEGSTLDLPNLLNHFGFRHNDLDEIDGSFKASIYKTGWGDGHAFHHSFLPPFISYHFNANKLQDYLQRKVEQIPSSRIFDQNVTHDMIDADYIIDCSGKPSNYDDYYESEYIPVNAVHVTQCYWDHTRFQYSLTLARPYGWVFGIPLQNRCSIGYLYNSNINTLDEVKEDVKNIFKEYNLEPSDVTNSFQFKNYYRKENFTQRVAYNGNASFFLEPLEATSIHHMIHTNLLLSQTLEKNKPLYVPNSDYLQSIQQIEKVIMLHYAAGSIWDTEFWRYAKPRGQAAFKAMLNDPVFAYRLQEGDSYGSWPDLSFKLNLKHLNLI